ncbi:MAG: protein jag [Lachnospiraceae bacterium]|nr:protein jag [Lachnospiraceae bacterium]
MDVREFSGKTVEDALTQATVELGVTSDKLDYEVVEKGSSGILGIGAKDAVIKVSLKGEEKEEVKEETSEVVETKEVSEKKETLDDPSAAIDIISDFLKDVFSSMNLEVEITSEYDEEDNTINVDLKGPEMGIIIGKRGQTLDSLQYLTNLALNRKIDTYTRVKLDTEDYRRRRKETLENLAKNCAYKAKRTKRAVSLEAMNPYERRIIHYALQDDEYVTTHSEGEEPYRHVVITLKK